MLDYLTRLWYQLLPAHCVLCHRYVPGTLSLCSACRKDLPILPEGCKRCAKTLYGGTEICASCLKHPPPFDRTHVLFEYHAPITGFITGLKFNHQLQYARLLGELQAEMLLTHWYKRQKLPDCLLPVPLQPSRLKERGFNESLEIAKPIAKCLNIALNLNICQRVKATAPQSELTFKARASNVSGAFAITGPVKDLHIAVIDDVITTGNTVKQLSAALKAHGAAQVDIWCSAYTLVEPAK